jgi:hypothetical protein
MKGSITALCLPLLLGAAAAAHATSVTVDFNDTKNSTANAMVLASAPNGAVTNLNIGGRNAVETGGTADNEFLYVALPKGAFANSKAVWAVIDYYDQGTDAFATHFTDTDGNDVQAEANLLATTKHDTKAWTTYSIQLTGFGFTEAGPGGADVWIDDQADGPEIIDKITITDEDPSLTHFPHVDPANPIKIDGVITPGEWDGAYTVTLNQASQDAVNNYPGADKFSGVYYYKWDETGLYVRGDVTDVTPRLNDAGAGTYGPPAYWSGDGIEEFIALDWSDPSHSTYLPGTDFHVFVGLGDAANGSLPPSWAINSASGDHDLMEIPAANLAITNTTTPVGYQFEFLLPWQKLLDAEMNTTTKVVAGQKIGWFMFANNSNELPSNQDNALDPVKRTGPSGNPSKWVTTVLEPFQAPAATSPTAGP